MALSGHRSAQKISSGMIQAIVGLVIMVVVAFSIWEVLSGVVDIIVGLFMVISGAILYCLSFPIEYLGRATRIFRRSF